MKPCSSSTIVSISEGYASCDVDRNEDGRFSLFDVVGGVVSLVDNALQVGTVEMYITVTTTNFAWPCCSVLHCHME